MDLPNKSKAQIPTDKITGYLLSETHAVGKSKAKFFRSLGFDETNVDKFIQALLNIAASEEVQEAIKTPHGTKYVIDGTLNSQNGDMIPIRSVWIVEFGEDNPRFVTAYPVE